MTPPHSLTTSPISSVHSDWIPIISPGTTQADSDDTVPFDSRSLDFPSSLHPNQAFPATPFIRGRSQPFPPPVDRSYPQYPYPCRRGPNQSLPLPVSTIQPSSSTRQGGCPHPGAGPRPASRQARVGHRGGLAPASLQARSEQEV